jgi:hypothetical protein
MRKTNPISPARPGMGAGWWGAMPRRNAIVQNEANFEVSSCRGQVGEVKPVTWLDRLRDSAPPRDALPQGVRACLRTD